MTYHLGNRSLLRLEGVHEDLVAVVKRAIEVTEVDFTVLEGLRTLDRQRSLLKKAVTTTLNSRHLTGHAVDLGAWVDSKVSWDWHYYHEINAAMSVAAYELGINVQWGGNWKTFPDGPHFQLPWRLYPKGE